MATSSLSFENPIFRVFIGYAGIVLMKTILMSLVTAYYRFTEKAFVNEEDAESFMKENKKLTMNNPSVERSRRAHLNDLENVLPFILLGLLYVTIGPTLSTALLHFRIFTISRLVHTVSYLLQMRQPTRAITFLVGLAVNVSLAFQLIAQGSY